MPHFIKSSSDLRHYGFNLLTGEACNYGLRILCDVNEDAAKLYCTVLGLPRTTNFDTFLSEPWNPGTPILNKPAVGSVFLPHDLFGTVAVFALYSRPDVKLVIKARHQYIGLQGLNEKIDHWKDVYDAAYNYDYENLSALLFYGAEITDRIRIFKGIQPNNTVRNGSCVHAYSGRSQS